LGGCESFGEVHLSASVCSVKLICKILLREFFGSVLASSFCKPSLFGYVGLPARSAKFFILMSSCLSHEKRFMIGVSVHNHSWRVSKFHAQQSVHLTCGSLRDLQAFFWL
jgi:hypothetical protein